MVDHALFTTHRFHSRVVQVDLPDMLQVSFQKTDLSTALPCQVSDIQTNSDALLLNNRQCEIEIRRFECLNTDIERVDKFLYLVQAFISLYQDGLQEQFSL